MMSTAIALFLAGVSADAFASTVTRSTLLQRSASAFLLLVGDTCGCNENAYISASGKTLKIVDDPECSLDIEKLAIEWQNEMDWPVTSVAGTLDETKARRLALERELGKAPNPSLRFLTDSKKLRCLVFATPHKASADNIIADTGLPKKRRKVRRTSVPPIFDGLRDDKPDRGLYQNYNMGPRNLEVPST